VNEDRDILFLHLISQIQRLAHAQQTGLQEQYEYSDDDDDAAGKRNVTVSSYGTDVGTCSRYSCITCASSMAHIMQKY
jgi:hypothetical protein